MKIWKVEHSPIRGIAIITYKQSIRQSRHMSIDRYIPKKEKDARIRAINRIRRSTSNKRRAARERGREREKEKSVQQPRKRPERSYRVVLSEQKKLCICVCMCMCVHRRSRQRLSKRKARDETRSSSALKVLARSLARSALFEITTIARNL